MDYGHNIQKTSYPTYCTNVTFDVNKLQPIMPKLNKYWYSTQEKMKIFGNMNMKNMVLVYLHQ